MSSSSESDQEEYSNENYINQRKRQSNVRKQGIMSKKQRTEDLRINEGASTSSGVSSNQADEV